MKFYYLKHNRIMYTYPDYKNGISDNSDEVVMFIGGTPECNLCGGYGEYETEYGPKGCQLCNSRLIPFIDYRGKMVAADWGDEIIKGPRGLKLIRNNND